MKYIVAAIIAVVVIAFVAWVERESNEETYIGTDGLEHWRRF